MTAQELKILVVDDQATFGRVLKAGRGMHAFTVRYEALELQRHPTVEGGIPVSILGSVVSKGELVPRHVPVPTTAHKSIGRLNYCHTTIADSTLHCWCIVAGITGVNSHSLPTSEALL